MPGGEVGSAVLSVLKGNGQLGKVHLVADFHHFLSRTVRHHLRFHGMVQGLHESLPEGLLVAAETQRHPLA